LPRVAANGARLHAQALGPPDDPVPVAALHGLLVGNMAPWFFALPTALPHRRLLLHDLRGHGRSDFAPSGYSATSLATDLEALLDHFGARRVDLAGHSFGAVVALRFALKHPDRVRRLALVEAPLPPSRMRDLEKLFVATPAELVSALPDDVQRQIGDGGRRARRWVERLGRLICDSSLVADLRAEPDIPNAELATLQHPALCLYGRSSGLLPVGERLAAALPDGRLEVIDGGHYLLAERPAEVARLVAAGFHG
jgi:pimeloyl-ACP methyl ester carboxylesterase